MPITNIQAVAPSVVGVNEPFSLSLRLLAEPREAPWHAQWDHPFPSVAGPFNLSPRDIRYLENTAPPWDGVLKLRGDDGYEGPAEASFAPESKSACADHRPIRRVPGLRFCSPGVKFLRVRDPAGSLEAVSNPIRVEPQPPSERLFWGDLHVHTIFTDGLRCPEELYAFARDEAFLDICALSDHSEGITDAQWEYFTDVTNRHNQSGRFVTLIGGEWTSMPYGHRNYYYRGDRGPIFRSLNPRLQHLDQFHAAARRHRALVIPHHPANATMGVDWSKGHDPEIERLVEIHSVWGNSERLAAHGNPFPIRFLGGEKAGQHVVDALQRGYRLGFIGGGDIHDGRPGDELHQRQEQLESYRRLHRQGVMGVWARELTREAIFDALWRRRVYATMNHRAWLRFSINGQPMGSELRADGRLSIHIEAASDCPIQRIALVRGDGDDAQIHEPNELTASWQTTEPPPPSPTWYYVRLTRRDGLLAWSSPIWVEKA